MGFVLDVVRGLLGLGGSLGARNCQDEDDRCSGADNARAPLSFFCVVYFGVISLLD